MDEMDDDNRIDEDPLESDIEELGDENRPKIDCCGGCGADVYDDSVQCPVCGQYIFSTTAITDRRSWLWVLVAAAVIIAFLCYVLI